MTSLPPLHQLYYHRDFDGVVAAAMVQATTETLLDLRPAQYAPNLNWTAQHLAPGTAIVDFLFHPEAALWVDHHETTFATEAARTAFRADSHHVFVPSAASCPEVIAELSWFEGGEHWREYIRWASVIDGAAYESAAQANDFGNPYVLLAHVIAELADVQSLATLIRAIGRCSAVEVLETQELRASRTRLLHNDAFVRGRLDSLLRVEGAVALLDQATLDIPYRRYLAYELYPHVRYGIGLYRSGEAIIVSVGQNPWNEPGPVNLGQLCREFGGGGRQATAGVPVASVDAAKELASTLMERLNVALHEG